MGFSIHSSLKTQHQKVYQNLTPAQKQALSPKTTWNVQLQHVGKGKTALRYLARYVCKSGFINKRLIGYDSTRKNILLRWTPSGTKETKILKLSIHEFIRRWLLHVLPKGFIRVRHYGYLSSASKKKRLRIRALLGKLSEPTPILPEQPPHCCPHCEGKLQYLFELQRLTPKRGPPISIPSALKKSC